MGGNDQSGLYSSAEVRPAGFLAIAIFLFFGASIACLAAITLLWQGMWLGRIWHLNPAAYKQLVPLGSLVGMLFLLLAAALTVAGIGWLRAPFGAGDWRLLSSPSKSWEIW